MAMVQIHRGQLKRSVGLSVGGVLRSISANDCLCQ